MASNTDLQIGNSKKESPEKKHFSDIPPAGRIMILVLLTAVICPGYGEARSSIPLAGPDMMEVHKNPLHDFSFLINATWEEIEKKLDTAVVSLEDLKKMLKKLAEVATDSKNLKDSKVRSGLADGNLDNRQKEILLKLAGKYGLDTVDTLKKILEKEHLSSPQTTFAHNQYNAVIRKMIDACDKYIKLRELMLEDGAIEENDRKLLAFRALKADLENRI